MSLKHSACHTFRASEHLRWAPFRDSFRRVFFDVFSGLCRVKKLPKCGRRSQNALWRFGSYLLSILSHNAKSMAGAILEGHLPTQKNMFFRCFLGAFFLHFLGLRGIHTTPKKTPFWLTFGNPLGAFGPPLGDFS